MSIHKLIASSSPSPLGALRRSGASIGDFHGATFDEELPMPAAVVFYSAVHCVSCVPTHVEHFGRAWLHVDEQIPAAEERRHGMNTGRAVRADRSQVGDAAFEPLLPEGSEIRRGGGESGPRCRRLHLFGGAGLGEGAGGGAGTGILTPGASGMSGTSVTRVTKCRVSPKQEVGSPTFSS